MSLSPKERDAGRVWREAKARERKAKKRERPANPKADRGRVRDPAFLAFLRRQPCCVGAVGCSGSVEAAHIRMGRPGEPPTGMQRKPSDTRAVPLCRGHHRDGPDAQHASNERDWWAKRGLDPFAVAGRLYVQFLKGETP